MTVHGRVVFFGIALAAAAAPVLAVEGALGRTLPGVWIQPQGAVIGPASGFSFTMFPIGYMGTIGGSRLVPIGGSIVANVDANFNLNYIVPQYTYKTETNKVSFSSSFLAPVAWVGSTASLQVNNLSGSISRTNSGIGDVVAVPLTVGIHFSENNNLAISSMIFAPTGPFRTGSITNLGMNEWTVMPNIAHTYLWKKRGLEFDNFAGFDIYSKDYTNNYTSGTMFHWDGMVIQYFSERFGIGAIGSTMKQITPDQGPIANVLHGFEGNASGVGPMVLWVAKTEKPGVVLQLRWVNEFKVTNLLKGNMLMLGCTLKFK